MLQHFQNSTTSPAVPVLNFDQTAEVIGRMQRRTRQRVGGMEVVAGEVDGEEVALAVDTLGGGGSIVVHWCIAPDVE